MSVPLTPTTEEGYRNTHSRERRKPLPPLCVRLARAALGLLFVILASCGAVLSVSALGRETYRWHGLEIELRLLPALQGVTQLALKPLGEIQAKTHRAPVKFVASLERIEVDELKGIVTTKTDMTALTREFEGYAQKTLKAFVLRQIAFAGLGALVAPLLFRSLRPKHYLLAALIGTGLMGTSLGCAISTFDRQAFNEVTYTGAFKQAPWVIRFGKDAFTKFDALSSKLRLVADNLNTLYGRIAAVQDSVGGTEAQTIRVLHISDLHNNAAAFDFVRKVADQFKAAFIVDTGDLTDFGSPPELPILERIRKLPYRYFWAAGNHDSETIIAAMKKLSNVTVLDGQIVKVDDLRFLGLTNPAARRDGVGSVDALPEATAANAARLLLEVTQKPEAERPDVVVTHDPRETVSVWGQVPVAMVGHLHRQSLDRQQPAGAKMPTVVSNAGTTGAAGLRYFEGQGGKASFTCSVLTFSKPSSASPRPRLRAVDLIELDGGLNQYSISHQTF